MAYGREDSPSSGRPQSSNLGGPARSGAGGAGGTRRSSTGQQRESQGSIASSSRSGAGPQRSTTSGGGGNYGRSDSPSSGRPQGSNMGGGRQGGAGMGFQGSVSRPGSYAGPKGAFSLENQALAAAHGPYGNYSQVTDPAGHLMQRMQARSWSPNTTRGMIGNFSVESGLNPLAAGDLNNPKGLAAGLGQHRLDRLAALQAETRPFEGLNRKTKTFASGPSLDQQADFIDREMRGLSTNTNKGAMKVGRTFQANPNMPVAQATETFARGYERPSKAALRSSMPQRLAGTGFDFGESTAPGLTQIAGRESTITPASYATAMPRAKPDIRGMTMGMPREKPGAAFARMSPAMTSAFAAPRTAIPGSIFGGGFSQLGRTRGRQ